MAKDQSFQPTQPLIFDFVQRGRNANPSTQDSPAVGSRTRSRCSDDLPERTADQQSKKQRKAEQKRQRKNRRSAKSDKSRNLSGESSFSLNSNDPSPPPSPQSTRTFSQILNDALPTQTDESPNTLSLQEQLIARIDHLEKANTALKVERDLLNDDLNSATKLLDKFKKSTKKLTTENDNLKRESSRKSGFRQFATSTVHTQTETTTPHIQETTDLSVAKFNSFCEHVTTIAQSLLDDFSNSKLPSSSTSSTPPSESFHIVPPRKRPAKSTAQPQGTPIPVIQTGTTRPPCPPTYSQVVTGQNTGSSTVQRPRRAGQGARKRIKTIILGTSLTDGLSTELNKHGIPSTTHIYRGGKLDLLRDRAPHIFSNEVNKQPDKILLLAGGNDAEESSVDMTINEYEGLVRDVRTICPQAKIIISAIPPRKDSSIINNKIKEVNDYLYDRGQRKDNVFFVDVVPKESNLFTKKKVHFNDEGKATFARNLKPFLID